MEKKTKYPKKNPIYLTCYTIRFKNQNGFIKIKDVFAPKNFKEEMSDFMTQYLGLTYENPEGNRILHLVQSLSLQSNLVSGVMKRGHNGQETDIEELVDGKAKTVNTVKYDQYNSIHFYFLICSPNEDSNYLIFMAQTYKQYGFKDIFVQSYKEYIRLKFGDDNLNCSINPLSIPQLFSNYLKKGDIRKLRFQKHTLSKNLENVIGESDNQNVKDYEVELTVRAKKKGFNRIKNIDFDTTKLVEVFDFGFEYDEAYADISLNGRERSINITHPEKFVATFDITDRVMLDSATNRPIYSELNKEAIAILKEEILINL